MNIEYGDYQVEICFNKLLGWHSYIRKDIEFTYLFRCCTITNFKNEDYAILGSLQ